MIDHPFMDFKSLTDEELSSKESQIFKNLQKANMWGSSDDIIGQLNWTLEMIYEEKMERMNRQMFDDIQSTFPKIIDSDPEIKTDHADLDEIKTTVIKPELKKPNNMEVPLFHKEYTKKNGSE